MKECVFCRIAAGEIKSHTVYEDERIIVFLDNGPLFAGHALVCPKEHVDTMLDLSSDLMQPLFGTTQMVARAVEKGLDAEGTLIAVNNKVSQSVPHLHVHVIPRRRKDGLRGFFWPRQPYRDEAHALEIRDRLRAAIEAIRKEG
jgi:histidine triad (HIT) family protein